VVEDHPPLIATAAGYATIDEWVDIEGEIVIRLRRERSIQGRVVDAGSGRPVAGVRVWARDHYGRCFDSWRIRSRVVSDVAGRFALHDLPEGEIDVLAGGRGWVARTLRPDLNDGERPFVVALAEGETREMDSPVVPAVEVEGRVLDATDAGMAGVEVHTGHRLLSVVTDASGRFRMDALPAEVAHTFTVLAPGHRETSAGPYLAVTGETLRVEIRLPKPRWLEVLVVDAASGQPIPGARVEGLSEIWRGRRADFAAWWTDERGRTLAGPLPGRLVWLKASNAGFIASGSDTAVPPAVGVAEPGSLRMELHAGLAISGRFFRPAGRPVGPLDLDVGPAGGGVTNPKSVEVDSEDQGRFRVGGLLAGRYGIRATTLDWRFYAEFEAEAGTEGHRVELVPIAPDPEEDDIPADDRSDVPERARTIEGTVRGPAGEPVRGARVDGGPAGSMLFPWVHTHTASDGTYRLVFLRDGPYELECLGSPSRFSGPRVRVPGGSRGVDFRLRHAACPLLSVVDAAGRPVARASIGTDDGQRWTADVRGRARLGRLDPDRSYELEVWGPESRRVIPAWTPEDTTVRLPAGRVLRGVVRDARGRAMREAMVAVRIDGEWSVRESDHEGAFSFTRLPPGTAVLQAEPLGLDAFSSPEVTVTGSADDLVLVIPAGAPLRVRVRNWPDGTIARATLHIEGADRRLHGDVDPLGRVTFPWVPVGRTATVAVGPVGEEGAWAYGRGLAPGDRTVVLSSGAPIRGRIVVAGDGALPEAGRFSVKVRELRWAEVETFGDGTFRVSSVPSGQWTIRCRCRDGDTEYGAEDTVEAGGTVTLRPKKE
jgi:protocatechuate 3,4-dioxygenase beta subunit